MLPASSPFNTETLEGDGYESCVRCGLCLPSCPTYLETLVETSGPRGRLALMRSAMEGRLDTNDAVLGHQLSECLGCRACETACPSGVPYGALLEASRRRVRSGKGRVGDWRAWLAQRILVPQLLGHYRHLRLAARSIVVLRRIGLLAVLQRSGILGWLGLGDVSVTEYSQHIAPRFLAPQNQRWGPQGDQRATVFFHIGCLTHVAFADLEQATIRLLRRVGCEVVTSGAQTCCGALATQVGATTALDFAKRNIAAFELSGASFYVTNAGSCGTSLKQYGTLLAADPAWAERAQRFSAVVQDVTEFLDTVGLPPGMAALDEVVVYQDACQLAHAQRIATAPRRLLAQIPGIELREMPESGVCCGAQGLYPLTQPEMAMQLQRRKIMNALRAGPTVIATASPSCTLHLFTGLRQAGSPVRVRHVVELLDEAYVRAESVSSGSSVSEMRSDPAIAASIDG